MAEENLEPTMQELLTQQKQLLEQQAVLQEELRTRDFRPKKDLWDVLSSIAPILSGAIIAMGGAYFTTIYNQQQLKLQEIQTIEKFIPHLTGDERSKRAAILAISSLTDAQLAAKVAGIYASEGTVSALESIAEHGSSGDRQIAKGALPNTLDNMAENYKVEKRYEDAVDTYKKSLALRQADYGEQSPRLILSLSRLADLYMSHNEYSEAEALLQKAISIQKASYGNNSVQTASALRSLADLYRKQGSLSKAEAVLNQAIAIEQNLPASAASDKSQVASQIDKAESAGSASAKGLEPSAPSEPKAESRGEATPTNELQTHPESVKPEPSRNSETTKNQEAAKAHVAPSGAQENVSPAADNSSSEQK